MKEIESDRLSIFSSYKKMTKASENNNPYLGIIHDSFLYLQIFIRKPNKMTMN